ncbi:MAG TPA: Lrp/AsnC family transcriptional regulator [Dongiaceae bacterium]|jgi:Lrp/AsnC family transcriptional regulator
MTLDKFDRRILALLQQDAVMPVAELAEKVGLSASPCWRRVQKLEAEGYIRGRVALLDARKMNLGVTVFAAIRTNQHSAKWLEAFSKAVVGIPEILEVYRMSGQIDYMLRIVVPDIAAYDRVYRRLIAAIEIYDVSSAFAMEVLKSTTVLPVDYA